MKKTTFLLVFLLTAFVSSFVSVRVLFAQIRGALPTPTPVSSKTAVFPTPHSSLAQESDETLHFLDKLLLEQKLGPVWPNNPLKYAIRSSVSAGVPTNTIVLLLLLPLVAAVIAAARHIFGLRGFGIFLPAALSVVFVAIGPVAGIGLFLIIILTSAVFRAILRGARIKLQYLPKNAMLLLFVAFGVLLVLFAAPIINRPDIADISIFPVLILALLVEDFSRVQLGKSAKVAVNMTTETLILSLASYIILTFKPMQEYALLHPELLFLIVLALDYAMGKYIGLRFFEMRRFRKLITK